MSYDLLGVRPRNGETVDEAVERLEELPEDETPPSDAEWDRMLAIGDALSPARSSIATKIPSVASSSLRPNASRSRSIVRRRRSAFPYWSGDRSDPGMTEAARYVSILASAGGFAIWDPQEEHIVTPDAAPEQVAKGHAASARVVLPELGLAAN